MKKKTAVLLTSILMLAGLLTTSYFTPPAASLGEGNHWKIMLAQKYCNAWIEGVLSHDGIPIPGTEFFLDCICELPEPQPLGQFVFWKVWTPPDMYPNDIEYIKYIDTDKNGTPDIVEQISHPIPYWDDPWPPVPNPDEPHTYYQHVEEGPGPFPPDYHWMVVVEVREQPFDLDRPIFEWQITMKTHGVQASFTGTLTLNDVPLPGTDFSLATVPDTDPDLQCQVVQTEWCTVPNDILGTLTVDDTPVPIDLLVTQFPWKYTYGPPGANVTLELTEVQSHHYTVMGGETASAGFLGPFPAWDIDGWKVNDGVPFSTRAPYMMPQLSGQVITFEQRDPISGIVKLGTPADSYEGLEHAWYSFDVQTWFRLQITLETQGCGWIFTGVGKQPIDGSVDYKIYNNEQGVFTYGPNGLWENKTGDDEQLAGEVPGMGPGGSDGAAGAGPPIGPCLQLLRGPDGIPGTGDDPIGRGDPDGPNPPGSSIYYIPSKMRVDFWNTNTTTWELLFASPWPQLFTTGTAFDKVIEDSAGTKINGANWTATGEPWEYYAGIDHPSRKVGWKDSKCNAYATMVCVWSVLNTETELGRNDNLFYTKNKLVRDDLMIADINCDETCNILDIVLCALAFDAQDEYVGPDGIPLTADDQWIADANYDARGDIKDTRGKVNILDIVKIALDFDETLG